MLANTKALVLLVSCALVAHAQTNTSPAPSATQTSIPGLDSCIIGCSSSAAASTECGTYTNVTCTCTSQAFQAAALACLTSNCTSADLQTAEQAQQQACGALNASSGMSTASSTGSSTKTSTSATQSASHSSAAMALSAPLSFGSLVGTLVASVGALVGAAFVL